MRKVLIFALFFSLYSSNSFAQPASDGITISAKEDCGASHCFYDYLILRDNRQLARFENVPAVNGGLQVYDPDNDGRQEFTFELVDITVDSIPYAAVERFPLYVCQGTPFYDCTSKAKEMLKAIFAAKVVILNQRGHDDQLDDQTRMAVVHMLAVAWYLGREVQFPVMTKIQQEYALKVLPEVLELMPKRVSAILPE